MNLIVFRTRTTRRSSTPRARYCQIKNYKFLLLASACYCIAALFGSSAIAAGPPPASSWVQLSPANSPPPRSYLAMTYDVASGKVIMFGGFDGTTYLNDTWIFEGNTWTKVSANHAPPARANAGMAYDVITQKVVLFGGYDAAICLTSDAERAVLPRRHLGMGWKNLQVDESKAASVSYSGDRADGFH
jgi:hypothetical protein